MGPVPEVKKGSLVLCRRNFAIFQILGSVWGWEGRNHSRHGAILIKNPYEWLPSRSTWKGKDAHKVR